METIGDGKSYEKRQKAMQGRLKKIGLDNPVVKQAYKESQPRRDKWEDFDIIHKLVTAAQRNYEADGNLKQCLLKLGEAIKQAAGQVKNGGNSPDDDDDY